MGVRRQRSGGRGRDAQGGQESGRLGRGDAERLSGSGGHPGLMGIFPDMRRSWAGRATIALLIAGILGGGSGAPVLDAVVYHLGGRPDHPVTHLEPKGTRHNHDDACTLGWQLRVQPSASATFVAPIIPVRLAAAALPLPPSPPRATASFSPQRSRAPPARIA